tara:strand:- start:6387 stop:7013 length:627 start_codon:yes stop_codon:yes gene_type:complete
MKTFTEELGINGHLTIIKQYTDGKEEIIFDDHNIIVSGMGTGLAALFTGSGSNSILDYQIDRFQLGTSGRATGVAPDVLEVSSTYQLSGELAYSQYGGGSNLYIDEANLIRPTGSWGENKAFALIPAGKITRINDTSVRYTLVVDEEAANGILDAAGQTSYLSEVGLFLKNPLGTASPYSSILAAYRTFTAIEKTSDFSLIFRWTINF